MAHAILWICAVIGVLVLGVMLMLILVCAAVWNDGPEPNEAGLHGRY